MFDVNYSNQAAKFLKSSEKVVAARLIKKIEELQKEPIIHDSKLIVGSKEKLFRVRVGDYRILYEVDYTNKMVGIVRINKRARAYD